MGDRGRDDLGPTLGPTMSLDEADRSDTAGTAYRGSADPN
jgi:hypothetical protein